MPNYYLSYIEINGHASTMLSVQEEPKGPAKIISEVGFGYDDTDVVLPFKQYKGVVFEEQNASRAKYGKADIRHKTYEVSKEEVDNYFRIINRDRKKDLWEERWGDENAEAAANSESYQGKKFSNTPTYKLLESNCKTYAMGLFKEMGLLDALELKDVLVQIPGVKKAELMKINETDLICPLKDQFIDRFLPLQAKIYENISYLFSNRSSISVDQSQSSVEYRAYFNLANDILNFMLNNPFDRYASKAGFSQELGRTLSQMRSFLAHICTYEKSVKKLSQEESEVTKFDAVIRALKEQRDSLSELEANLKEITEKTSNRSLEFSWQTTPSLTERKALSKFTDIERTAYFTKAQATEVEGGLAQLILLIDGQKAQPNLDEKLRQDLNSLRQMIAEAADQVKKTNAPFLKSAPQKNGEDLMNSCVEQDEKIKNILKSLGDNISNLKPQSEVKARPMIRLINRVLNVFNISPLGHIVSAKEFLSQKVKRISEKQGFYSKQMSLFRPVQEKRPEAPKADAKQQGQPAPQADSGKKEFKS